MEGDLSWGAFGVRVKDNLSLSEFGVGVCDGN